MCLIGMNYVPKWLHKFLPASAVYKTARFPTSLPILGKVSFCILNISIGIYCYCLLFYFLFPYQLIMLSIFHMLVCYPPIVLLKYLIKYIAYISMCLVAQSFQTLCDPMDGSPAGSSVCWDSPGKNTGVGCYALLQGSSQSRNQTQVSCIAGGLFSI